MGLLYFIISAVLGLLVFSLLFKTINSWFHLFEPIQKFTNKLKKKRLYSFIGSVIFIFLATLIKDQYQLNDIVFGIIFGALIGLNNIIFDESVL